MLMLSHSSLSCTDLKLLHDTPNICSRRVSFEMHLPDTASLYNFAQLIRASVLTFNRKPLYSDFIQLQPEGRNARGGTRLKSPEVLGLLRALGTRPLVSAIRGLGEVFSFLTGRGKQVALQGAAGGSRFPGWPLKGFQPLGSYPRSAGDSFSVVPSQFLVASLRGHVTMRF